MPKTKRIYSDECEELAIRLEERMRDTPVSRRINLTRDEVDLVIRIARGYGHVQKQGEGPG